MEYERAQTEAWVEVEKDERIQLLEKQVAELKAQLAQKEQQEISKWSALKAKFTDTFNYLYTYSCTGST